MRRAALSVLLFSLGAAAQEPVCAVRGTVTDSVSNKPVPEARVLAMGLKYSLWRTADDSGGFCFARLDPGVYRILAQRAGYIDNEMRAAVDMETKLASAPLKIEINPNAVIAGKVSDSDGEPLERARVDIWTRTRTPRGFEPNSEDSTFSGPDGSFRFSALTGGTYYLSASRPAERPPWSFRFLDDKGQALGYVGMETFYSGSFTFAAATPLAVEAGQSIENLVLTIRKAPARHMAGRIANPPPNAFLELERDTETGSRPDVIPIRPDGTFSWDALAPSRYTLSLDDHGRTIAEKRLDLTTGDAVGITLEPVETVDLKMVLRTEGSGPAFQPPAQYGGFLLAVGSEQEWLGQLVPDGTYEFRGVKPGIYRYLVRLGEQNLYIKRITVAGVVQEGTKVDLRSAKPGVMEVLFSPNVAQIEGHVVVPKAGAEGAAEATVILVPETASGEEVRVTKQSVADEKGRFKLAAVPPGKYRLYAIQGFDGDEWSSAELAAALAAKSVAIELKEKESKSAQVTLILNAEWEAAVKRTGN
jgi:hypothetical protein